MRGVWVARVGRAEGVGLGIGMFSLRFYHSGLNAGIFICRNTQNE